MPFRFLFAFIWLLGFNRAISQEYNYVHYNTQDGLAGSTVYDMCQDKDGFIWFATQNGLSRYDGTHFTNFTVKDGLSDNEVLKVFADSRGRVWIGSLSKTVSYYFKGKIHNKFNDKLLADDHLNLNAFVFCEDLDGNIAISNYQSVVHISPEGQITVITDLPLFRKSKQASVYVRKNLYGNGFTVAIDKDIYKYYKQEVEYFFRSQSGGVKYIGIKVFPNGNQIHIKAPAFVLAETAYGSVNIYESTVDGAWSIDTINYKLDGHFLPGTKVSQTLNDREGNIWFSTLGEGVYKLPSRQMKTFQFEQAGIKAYKEVFTISAYENKIIAGLSFSKLGMVNEDNQKQIVSYDSALIRSANPLSTNRLYRSLTGTDGNLYLGFDGFLARRGDGKTIFGDLVSIKSLSELDGKYLLVGNYANGYKVRKADLKVVDTIWHGRCTDLVYYNGMYYVGTIEGLFRMEPNKQQKSLGSLHPILQRRIVRMINDGNGRLYVATADNGLVVLWNDKVEYVYNDKNGLNSNICKSLYIDNNFIWLGTNKGLNKISLDNSHQIIKYSVSDGLPSNIINDVYVQDSMIWVASPKGLTYFNEDKIGGNSSCNLMLLGVTHNGKNTAANSYELFFRENKINFNFVAISHKSSGDIEYYYKLSGIDSNYKKTGQTEISFLSLPPGNYHFSLFAINKFGKRSRSFEADIVVRKPIWRAWWFYIVILAVASAITTWLVSTRNKAHRIRMERRNRFQRQLASLEQQALQAQMNPHFIFNCMNSIQQYMLTNDKEKANQYLNEFSLLIRQTLTISTKASIPIEDEVAYLSKYLEMEKMRFGDKFDFKISVDPDLLGHKVEVPSLLLQPYVENALRHGIRYKENGYGKVDVIFSKKGEMIYCRLIDNGVGRQKAAEFKGIQHIEYQSKGTQLTARRIRLINTIYDSELSSEIIDLYDDMDNPAGTEVIVKIPMLSPVSFN